MNDADRFDLAVKGMVGKRLTYAEATGKVGENPDFQPPKMEGEIEQESKEAPIVYRIVGNRIRLPRYRKLVYLR